VEHYAAADYRGGSFQLDQGVFEPPDASAVCIHNNVSHIPNMAGRFVVGLIAMVGLQGVVVTPCRGASAGEVGLWWI